LGTVGRIAVGGWSSSSILTVIDIGIWCVSVGVAVVVRVVIIV
jgi:hypothetical protein